MTFIVLDLGPRCQGSYGLYQIQVQELSLDVPSRIGEQAVRRGELAQQSGCNIETVRFYEKQGLLPAPPRTAGGHRDYAQEHLRRLTFIRRSRELGFTLDEVRNLLALVDCRDWTCAEVKALTLEHLADVRRKIADLQQLAVILGDMAAQCDGGAVPECPIIDALMEST